MQTLREAKIPAQGVNVTLFHNQLQKSSKSWSSVSINLLSILLINNQLSPSDGTINRHFSIPFVSIYRNTPESIKDLPEYVTIPTRKAHNITDLCMIKICFILKLYTN